MILTALSTYISYWQFKKHIEAAGLLYSHYNVLELLSSKPNISAQEIQGETETGRVPTLVKINALLEARLIKVSGEYRQPGARGRASRLYSLTEGGHAVLEKVTESFGEQHPKAA